MDLIYADETRKDIGVLNSYELDMAYGKDENDFTCSVDRNDHCCSVGFFIYAEGTEYGGIVDRIKVDTEKDAITYSGRTWHGVLESKVICPDPGEDYLILSGESNEVLQAVFDHIGLSGLFIASDVDTEVEISNYQFERYVPAYTGIKKMLKANGMKLQLSWENGMVKASAEPIYDYSQDDEFDTSQVDFTIEKNYRPVNHIICLGQGNLRDRAVIHIYTDENGGVQPYLVDPDEDPVEDSDYILDTSQQVLFDQDDVVQVYDVSNAEITTNYVALTSKPDDWESNCEAYYSYEPSISAGTGTELDLGGQYKEVQKLDVGYELLKKQPYDWTENYDQYYTYDDTQGYRPVTGTLGYTVLTRKPGNWSTAYSKYFRKSGSNYINVTGVTSTKYVRQTKQPADWLKNYGQYYYRTSDGVTAEYRNTEGASYNTYPLQSMRPTDWWSNFASYFRKATARELRKNKKKTLYAVSRDKKGHVPAWKAKTYHTKVQKQKAPVWKEKTRYTRVDTTLAPAWSANTYYQQVGNTAPAWSAGTYYLNTGAKAAPEFVSGKYFRKCIDHYAVMVAGALEKLAEYHASDDLSIDLEETDQTYDVGDIVGTREEITGMEATQEVIKKIITISNDDIVIRYEVG